MRGKGKLMIALAIIIVVFYIIVPVVSPEHSRELSRTWSIGILAIGCLTVLGMLFEFEERHTSTKIIALIAMIGTISAVSRVPFATIPSIQPCTFFTICTGLVFGPIAGFMVGAISAAVSNLFLGQGPWTIFQMLGWGLAGLTSGFLRNFFGIGKNLGDSKRNLNLLFLSIYGAMWGYIYGWTLNIWHWVTYVYPLTWKTFVLTQLTSFWFDTMHAIGNVVFILMLAPKTISMLERYKKRFEVIIENAPEKKIKVKN